MNEQVKILKGNIIFTKTSDKFEVAEQGYLVYTDNQIEGVYENLPESYAQEMVEDYGERLIIPGLSEDRKSVV